MTQQTIEQLDAREQFRAAYENRYTWDSNFPGYTADLTVIRAGETHIGSIRVNSDLSIEVTGFADEATKVAVQNQLQGLTTHRRRSSFEQAHGKHIFSFGDIDAAGTQAILVQGDAMGSHYRLRGKEVCQVSRVIGKMPFTIDHLQSIDTGAGYLSGQYNAVFRNPETNEVSGISKYHDTYEQIGGYYVLTRQVVEVEEQGNPTTTDFTFSNLKLL